MNAKIERSANLAKRLSEHFAIYTTQFELCLQGIGVYLKSIKHKENDTHSNQGNGCRGWNGCRFCLRQRRYILYRLLPDLLQIYACFLWTRLSSFCINCGCFLTMVVMASARFWVRSPALTAFFSTVVMVFWTRVFKSLLETC